MRFTFRLIAAVLVSAVTALSASSTMAQVANGDLYAVIAPTFSDTTQSFVRLFNGTEPFSSTFTVTVVGSPSGRVYGTANISVPSKASPQYPLSEILSRAGAPALNGGDTSYALYIQSPDYATGYQHVTYNGNNGFFENNSLCKYPLNEVLASIQDYKLVLTNVHSTKLGSAGYPSTVLFHNYWTTPVTYTFAVTDARTGAALGQFNFATAAHTSYEFSVAEIESRIGFTPTDSQTHLNILVTDFGQNPPATLGQSIVNANLDNAQINMGTVCAVNPPSTISTAAGNAVIAPTFSGGTQSFIRLFNGFGGSNFTVTVYGSPSGRVYGTASIVVSPKASPQYPLSEILTRANAAALNGGDTSYSLYIQNSNYGSGYQHVTFNGSNGFFENNSLCKYLLNEVLASNADQTLVLTNVHSSQLGNLGYPSTVLLHNYSNSAVNYTFAVVDSSTGATLGQFNYAASPNASHEIPVTEIESRANVIPNTSQSHYNVLIERPGLAAPAVVGQSIVNSNLNNAQINMATVCAVNAPSTGTSGGGGDGGGGSIPLGW